MRRISPAFVALALVLAASPAQAAATRVVVFEGRGLGHGVGLPLDGAEAMVFAAEAEGDEVDADDILDRFLPGARRGRREGIVRVLVDATDRPEQGLTVVLPAGGAVRDGRTTAVAPSFPLNVPSGGKVRLTFDGGFHRAEVLGHESGALAASPDTVWIEPRQGGTVDVGDLAVPALSEFLVTAQRAHLVAEMDIEAYLRGIDPRPAGRELPAPVMEAAVVAARSYALRSAAAEMRVGRFHVFPDSRSHLYVGVGAPPTVARAARATRGEVLLEGAQPLPALVTASAAGRTAAVSDVFGADARALRGVAALDSRQYDTQRPEPWRVEMNLADVASRLGYEGTATGLKVGGVAPSGYPASLVVSGSDGPLEVQAPDFHDALSLPSTWFGVEVVSRAEPVPRRRPSPSFQRLPGPLLAAIENTERGSGGGINPFPIYTLSALTLGLAYLIAKWGRSRRNAPNRSRSGSG